MSFRGIPWSFIRFYDVPVNQSVPTEANRGLISYRCFCYKWEKWKKEMISEIRTSRKPAQMVWASVWLDERGRPRWSPLVIMERNPNAPRRGYSSQSYIKALRKGLLPYWRRSQLFMQDNACIHTLRATMEFLVQHGITPITWPAYSPDFNPIEHFWWHLKKRMYKQYPQCNNYCMAEKEWDGFCDALKECWRSIPGGGSLSACSYLVCSAD
jgi:transposase